MVVSPSRVGTQLAWWGSHPRQAASKGRLKPRRLQAAATPLTMPPDGTILTAPFTAPCVHGTMRHEKPQPVHQCSAAIAPATRARRKHSSMRRLSSGRRQRGRNNIIRCARSTSWCSKCSPQTLCTWLRVGDLQRKMIMRRMSCWMRSAVTKSRSFLRQYDETERVSVPFTLWEAK